MSIFRTATFWGVVTGVALFGALIVWGVAGWPGQPDDCTLPGGNCYCEMPAGATFAKQPANTWSNLVPFAAGLAILVIADIERARRRQSSPPAANPMLEGGFYAIGYGFVVLLLGPGSAAFHASLTNFGGFLDNLSMYAFIGFILVYDAFRIARADDNRTVFAVIYLAMLVTLGVVWWLVSGSGIFVFAGLVAAAVVLELVMAIWGVRGVQRPLVPWLALGLGTFAVALLVWRLSWTGAPLCDPTSLLQGHALWHVLAEAVAPLMFFAHFRREIRTALPVATAAAA